MMRTMINTSSEANETCCTWRSLHQLTFRICYSHQCKRHSYKYTQYAQYTVGQCTVSYY